MGLAGTPGAVPVEHAVLPQLCKGSPGFSLLWAGQGDPQHPCTKGSRFSDGAVLLQILLRRFYPANDHRVVTSANDDRWRRGARPSPERRLPPRRPVTADPLSAAGAIPHPGPTAPQPAGGGRPGPLACREPLVPAAGGTRGPSTHRPTPHRPQRAPGWRCSGAGLAPRRLCGRQGRAMPCRARRGATAPRSLPLSLSPSPPHSPNSTATTVLSRSQFFLRKPGQLHPFLPAFAIAAAEPGAGGAWGAPSRSKKRRSERRRRLPACLPASVRSALLRAFRGAVQPGRSPGNGKARPSARPRPAHSSARPLPTRTHHGPPPPPRLFQWFCRARILRAAAASWRCGEGRGEGRGLPSDTPPASQHWAR